MSSPKERVLVALSGGVDSSVTAALLKEAGHEVFSATLKTFCYAGRGGGAKACCGLEGIDAARAAAASLGIPHTIFDVSKEFERDVIDDFTIEYAAGRTPNPCVRCNATVKIPWLLEKARTLGCTAIATGHYARVEPVPEGGMGLFRGADTAKDQAYFLWEIPAHVLPHLRFPLGGMTKPQVRELARRFGLSNAEKPESQEICFVPDGDYVAFLRERLPVGHPGFQPGPIVDTAGNRLGTHDGYLGFTIGQRKGLGGGHGRRLFVVAIDPATRTVIAGESSDVEGRILRIDRVNSLLGSPLIAGMAVSVQIRHRAKALPAHIVDVSDAGSVLLELTEMARSITPGQSGVLFAGNRLIAGGRIARINQALGGKTLS
ncbi:tRNA 2-thiouridine(34) synthase MnmA [Candidatus Ozemobacteraceae bacterium]|nr:tRNA 2-thiouridine(34) synthase MnmA [Candidatus Ozemobacteraceae bacterium]